MKLRFNFYIFGLIRSLSAMLILLFNFTFLETNGINILRFYSFTITKELIDASLIYFLLNLVAFRFSCLIADCFLDLFICYDDTNKRQYIHNFNFLHKKNYHVYNIRLDVSNPFLYGNKTVDLLI